MGKRSVRQFQKLVREALAEIPVEFQPYLENLQVVVEEAPEQELLADLGIPEDEGLYGLYQGTPLTQRDPLDVEFPCRIRIYRLPLQEDFEDPKDLKREIAITVLHEVAHHFGLDEARLEELGWG